jgi:hypothetical protein
MGRTGHIERRELMIKDSQMTENTTTTTAKPVTVISRTAARLSFAAATVSLVLLAALHVIKPELDPSWRMVSEYAIGDHGWVMRLAFFSLAFSCASLFVAIRSQTRTVGGRIGLAVLLATAAAMTAAAIFAIDPITASKDELTTHGNLHALASMVGVPGLPVAAVLISRGLARNQAWSSARRSLIWTTNLTWISLLLMVSILAVMLPQAGGRFGPDVLIGWPNRLMLLAYGAWLMIVSWRVVRLGRRG